MTVIDLFFSLLGIIAIVLSCITIIKTNKAIKEANEIKDNLQTKLDKIREGNHGNK